MVNRPTYGESDIEELIFLKLEELKAQIYCFLMNLNFTALDNNVFNHFRKQDILTGLKNVC